MKKLLCILLAFWSMARAQIAPQAEPEVIFVEPGDSFEIDAAQTPWLGMATAYELYRDGQPVIWGWCAEPQTFALDSGDQLEVGHYLARGLHRPSDTPDFVPSFRFGLHNEFVGTPPSTRYRLPDSAWQIYMVPNYGPGGQPEPDPEPRDTTNLLSSMDWRYIMHEARGSVTYYPNSFVAETYEVPGVYAHTPQVVKSGWSTEKGDSLYAQFRVRGSIEQMRLDINTGGSEEPIWAFHFTDTIEVSEQWAWHTIAFRAQYTDPDNRFDFNLGIDTGRVEIADVSLRRSYLPHTETLPEDSVSTPEAGKDSTESPCGTDTLYLERVDTLYLERVDTLYLEKIVEVRDTVTLPPDTLTKYILPEFFLIGKDPETGETIYNQPFFKPIQDE